MSVRKYKDENNREMNSNSAMLHLFQGKTGNSPKFNISTEKKIERLWFQSRQLGWNYNDFVVRLLEVLVVLSHRNKVKITAAHKQGIGAKIRS
jgi:hypothetical protein